MDQNKEKPAVDAMGFPRLGILDTVIHVLTGTPDSMLTPKELGQRQKNRNDAYESSVSAAKNPGAEFMGPPQLDSSGGGSGIVSLIKSLFAGGAGGG